MAGVPTSGAWQTDPQLLALVRQVAAEGPHGPQSKGDVASPTMLALNRYVTQNRQRLGIPEGYGPSIRSGGQTLEDWSVPWLKEALIGGGFAAAPFLAAALTPQAASGSTLPGAAVPTQVGMTATPAAISSQGVSQSLAGGLGTLPGAAIGAGATGAQSALQRLFSGNSLASLAPVIAALTARGGSGTSGVDTAALARQQQVADTQMRRADPLHQAVTQLAYSRLPISARQGTTFNVLPLPQ